MKRRAILLLLLGNCAAVAVAQASPWALRVERLLERDALGVDTAQPTLSWSWRTANPGVERAVNPPARVLVSFAASPDLLDSQPLWAWHGEVGPLPSLRYDGPPLHSHTRVHWRVCSDVCTSASFVTGILTPIDWSAKWIRGRQLRSPEAPTGDRGAVSSAIVSFSGLGFAELMLNGLKVGDAVLDPGFSTNFTERILYSTWDVTHMLNKGEKSVVLGARIGAGKYSYSVNPFAVAGQDVFALLCQLTIRFADGSKPLILATTGPQQSGGWESSQSPIVWEHLYHGEVYDARLARPNWASPRGNGSSSGGSKVAPAITLPVGANATLSARLFAPIRIVETVVAQNVTRLGSRSFFYDYGNNYAGVARVALPPGMAAGATMTVVCTEYPNIAQTPYGPADLYNQQDLYIFSGQEKQGDSWAP